MGRTLRARSGSKAPDPGRLSAPSRSEAQKLARRSLKSSCERCGAPGGLHDHHRDGNWRNWAPSNIATLCQKCHVDEHDRSFGFTEARRPRLVTPHYPRHPQSRAIRGPNRVEPTPMGARWRRASPPAARERTAKLGCAGASRPRHHPFRPLGSRASAPRGTQRGSPCAPASPCRAHAVAALGPAYMWRMRRTNEYRWRFEEGLAPVEMRCQPQQGS